MSTQELGTMVELLAGVSDIQLRELGIQALRDAKLETGATFARHGEVGRSLLRLLAAAKGTSLTEVQLDSLKEVLHSHSAYPQLLPIEMFLDWLVRAGFALAQGAPASGFPLNYIVTESGARFLAREEGDHPLLPGAVERLRARCPGLPALVLELLVDAHACLERQLLRPAVTLAGVAYEAAVEAIILNLISRSVVADAFREKAAAARIAELKRVTPTLLPWAKAPDLDRRNAVLQACDFADDLRRRRNDAAHARPRFGFDDRAEAEELLVSAGRNLPALWLLHV